MFVIIAAPYYKVNSLKSQVHLFLTIEAPVSTTEHVIQDVMAGLLTLYYILLRFPHSHPWNL